MIEHTLGVVLAGGASRRMGTNKAAVEFGDMTLLERSVAVLSEVFSSVAVSGGEAIIDGVQTIPDRVSGMGPLGGLEASYLMAQDRSVFLLAVDLPLVDAAAIRAITEPQVPAMAVRVPVARGRRQPLCAVYGGGLGAVASACLDGQDRSMARLLELVDVEEILGLDDEIFTNINTPEDLAVARRSDRRRNTH